ncbi:MAG TPA: hypothetical protein VMC09_13745 [Anaerolineales bacterium]|nr:hypothetical protein [Anaerolineales bacterium]
MKRRRHIIVYILACSLLVPACTLGQFTAGKPAGPDITSEPAIIVSASAAPEVLMNGDTLRLTVATGTPGLVVTADLSALDSTRPGPVSLSETPGGIYKTVLDLSFDNTAANGMKTIPVKAVRAGGGEAAETTARVELNNPPVRLDPVPPDDDFSGQTLDPHKWSRFTENGGTVTTDGRLVAATDGKASFSRAMIESVRSFPGDFDVQVEFAAGPDWGQAATGDMDAAVLGAHIGKYSFEIIRLDRSPGEGGTDIIFAWSDYFTSKQETLTAALAGRFRLVRRGTRLYFLADLGKAWEVVGKMTAPDGPASIYLGNTSADAWMTCTTYFDNFHVNDGVTAP